MGRTATQAMSPYEYLEYLQRQFYDGQPPPFAADVGDVLTANLIASLPEEHRRQLEQIAIGVLPTKKINAWAAAVPSGGEVIGFDFGMMSFLIALNKILMSRVNILGLEPTMELEVAANFARDVGKSFFATGELPRVQVSPRRMIIASALSNVQISFAIGHELGHVLLGHLKKPSSSSPAKVRAQEHEADIRGGELALASLQRAQNSLFGAGDTTLAQAGIDIFFTYLIFMRDVLNQTEDPSQPYPSPEARRAKLRQQFWSDMPEQARELATRAEEIYAAFAAILEPEEEVGGPEPSAKETATQSLLPRKGKNSRGSRSRPKKDAL